ncbi:MAG: ribosome-associated translation inhibitor RaiA [Planctomycetota bacterium]|jgi:putative sigma-54 modulation protein|nr:ribosome-associated translation inhibitor RaiA [Planctomycetota bacterium]
MHITISAKHMELTQPIRDYIERKMSRLPHFFNRLQEIRVIIERVPHGYHVEVVSDVEHHKDFVANSEHRDLYACVDVVSDRAVRQLHEWKDRIRGAKKHIGTRRRLD